MKQARINITVPAEVHLAARIHCVAHGKTMAELVVEALSRLLAEEQRTKTA